MANKAFKKHLKVKNITKDKTKLGWVGTWLLFECFVCHGIEKKVSIKLMKVCLLMLQVATTFTINKAMRKVPTMNNASIEWKSIAKWVYYWGFLSLIETGGWRESPQSLLRFRPAFDSIPSSCNKPCKALIPFMFPLKLFPSSIEKR